MLTDQVIALRAIAAADISLLYEWRNDPRTRSMFRDDQPLNFDSHARFVQQFFENAQADYWWIVEAAHVPIGTISLYRFNADRRTCEFGRFIIGREYRALGYGRRALALAMSVARSLGVERISCEVLSTNDCALRLYDRCGFTVKAIDQTGLRRFISMEAELNKK
jgi:ribosomal-protein-alanine N-acetyltransferase